MATKFDISIARQSLIQLGQASRNLESTAERSPNAVIMSALYHDCRKECLERADWSFARRTANLSESAVPSTEGWQKRYLLPIDFLASRRVFAEGVPYTESIPFEVETLSSGVRTLQTDISSAQLRYTANVEDSELFSPMFKNALVYLLASRAAPPIVGGEKALSYMEVNNRLFERYVSRANASDGNQQRSREPEDPDWIRNR